MLNAKSLGVEKQIPLNPDMTYTKPTISTSGKKFKEVSNGFVAYNKYEVVFSGYLKMKACTVNANEKLLDLPVSAKYSNVYPFSKVNSELITLYVRDNELFIQNQRTFDEDDYLFIAGSFPISTGGG